MLANLTVIVGGGTFGDIGGQVAADQSGLLAPRLALPSTASRKVSTYSSMYNLQSTSICYFAMLVALLDTYSLPLVLLKTCQLLPCPCSCLRVFQLFLVQNGFPALSVLVWYCFAEQQCVGQEGEEKGGKHRSLRRMHSNSDGYQQNITEKVFYEAILPLLRMPVRQFIFLIPIFYILKYIQWYGTFCFSLLG